MIQLQMVRQVIIILITISTILAYEYQKIKTSIQYPLYIARAPYKEGVAIANQFRVQIILKDEFFFDQSLRLFKQQTQQSTIERDHEQVRNEQRLTQIQQKNQKNPIIYANSGFLVLKIFIIEENTIQGLYWGANFFIIKTHLELLIYDSKFVQILRYKVQTKPLSIRSLANNIYILEKDQLNPILLHQTVLNFDSRQKFIEKKVQIILRRQYKRYQYLIQNFDQWIYLVNETDVLVYDIINKRIKNRFPFQFNSSITQFKVDQTYSLAIAYNNLGDCLMFHKDVPIFSLKNASFTFATICSEQYLMLGDDHQFSIVSVGKKIYSSQYKYELQGLLLSECSFYNGKNHIYAVGKNGYLDIYNKTDSTNYWKLILCLIIGGIIGIFICVKCRKDEIQVQEELDHGERLIEMSRIKRVLSEPAR